jgi:hypothetical protein
VGRGEREEGLSEIAGRLGVRGLVCLDFATLVFFILEKVEQRRLVPLQIA